MLQVENKDLIGRILKSTIGVITRRTSEAYAYMIIGSSIKKLYDRYPFLNYIEIKGTQYKELFDILEINDEINKVSGEQIGSAIKDFIRNITGTMGKDAGFYFIKEIKDDLPFDYEVQVKEFGIDFDFLQTEFITEIKEIYKFKMENYEILKYIITIIYEGLDRKKGREYAYKTLSEIVDRIKIEYESLNYIKINDIRSIQGLDIVDVNREVNNLDHSIIGSTIQKLIQEVINSMGEREGLAFIENLKDLINADYMFKLDDYGVNFNALKMSQVSVVKQVLSALVNILSESSTESYAVLIVNNVLKKYNAKYEFLKGIKIDGLNLAQGLEAIDVPEEINQVRGSELGRSMQKIIEKIFIQLGDEAGKYFLDKFKNRLGKAYTLRIEEMGINLHMIELRKTILW